MKTKKLSTGFELPVLAIGTHSMGGEDYGPADYSKDQEYIKAIREAIKLGYTHIDTAEVYGGGHAEELIGIAIKNLNRKRLFITTKVSIGHLKYNDVINSAKSSLKRLGTNYIDLYLIHAPNPEIPLKETMAAMDFLVDNKFVKYIGVSSFDINQMKEAQKYSKHKIVANQLKYSLWSRVDIETIKYCQENDVMVIAYKPFGRGKITEEKIGLLSCLAKKYNKSEAQIVLNWLVSKKNVVALFTSTRKNHLEENLNIFDFSLSRQDSEKLNQIVVPLVKNE